jgi:two-component system, chemotaxis family, protein-glutamate methylesterase/glutaminase
VAGDTATLPDRPDSVGVVVVGASAGGVEALRSLVANLPRHLDAAVVVVLHVPPSATSALPMILGRATMLPVRHAEHGEPLLPGHVFVAPPDRHVVMVDGRLLLSAGPRENGHRPAVDVLFRSAARSHGPGTIAIVLSGGLDDGTAGMVAVRSCGGVGIAQLPSEALHPAMPVNAIESAGVDYVMPVAEIPALLDRLLKAPREWDGSGPPPDLMTWETQMALLDADALEGERPGRPSGLSCPDCHGVLFDLDEEPPRLRCRVGHAWTMTSLAAEQTLGVDAALWTALRSLEERAALASTMAERLRRRSSNRAETYLARQAESLEAAKVIRELILSMSAATVAEVEDAGDTD